MTASRSVIANTAPALAGTLAASPVSVGRTPAVRKAAIEADAVRIATLGECILETICDPDVSARQIGIVDALANTVKIMADRVASTAAKVEAFAATLPEEATA